MSLALGMILGNHHHADVIMNSLGSSKARVDVLRALATECVKDDVSREKLLYALERVRAVAGERNDMIHGLWSIRSSDAATMLSVRKPATKVPLKFEKVPASRVDDLVRRVSEIEQLVVDAALLVRQRDWQKPPASPDRQPPQ